MMPPKISVIMPTFCRVRCIRRAIESVLNQTFSDLEFIILDDGSSDGTKEIIEEYAEKDNRIRWVRFDENSQRPALRGNQGIALAQGKYLSFMFDDDEYYPNCLETLYNFHEDNPTCGMVYALCDFFDSRTNTIIKKDFGEEWNFKRIVEHGNYLGNLTVLVRREILNRVGGYDEHTVIRRLCDWDLWVRIGEKYTVKRIPISVGKVNAYQADSVGITMLLNIDEIRERQRGERLLPLKDDQVKKIVFLTHGHDACLQRWRIDYLIKSINKLDMWEASKKDKFTDKFDLDEFDVIVFYRYFLEEDLALLKSKVLIYDLDDFIHQDIFSEITENDKDVIKNYLNSFDGVSVASRHLQSKIPKSVIRRNAINIDDFKFVKKKKRSFRIGWLSNQNRNESNYLVLEILKLIKTPFIFVYFDKGSDFKRQLTELNIKSERKCHVPLEKPNAFYEELLDLDLVINPLPDSDFIASKSELKFIECGILKIPLITSKVGVFGDIITEENGFLASTPTDFKDKILFIKNNKKKVKEIVNRAYQQVSTQYNIDHIRDEYLTWVSSLIDKRIEDSLTRKLDIGIEVTNNRSLSKEILSGQSLIQSFISKLDGLCNISILAATYMRKNKGKIEISLMKNADDEDSILRNIVLDCSKISDNKWIEFKFLPIQKSNNSRFYLRIRGIDCKK